MEDSKRTLCIRYVDKSMRKKNASFGVVFAENYAVPRTKSNKTIKPTWPATHRTSPSHTPTMDETTPPSSPGREVREEKEGDYFAKVLPGHLMKDDPSLNWFQKPHTVTMFIVAGIIVLVAAFSHDQRDTEANVKTYDILFSLYFVLFDLLFLPQVAYSQRLALFSCSVCSTCTMAPFCGHIRLSGDL